MERTAASVGEDSIRQGRNGISEGDLFPTVTAKGVTKLTGMRAPEWWTHLRSFNKRKFWKRERKQSHARIRESLGKDATDFSEPRS